MTTECVHFKARMAVAHVHIDAENLWVTTIEKLCTESDAQAKALEVLRSTRHPTWISNF